MATQTNQEQLIAPSKGEIILYQTADGKTSIDVKLENETVWLTQAQMAISIWTMKWTKAGFALDKSMYYSIFVKVITEQLYGQACHYHQR